MIFPTINYKFAWIFSFEKTVIIITGLIEPIILLKLKFRLDFVWRTIQYTFESINFVLNQLNVSDQTYCRVILGAFLSRYMDLQKKNMVPD